VTNRKLAATIHAPAGAARNTRSVMDKEPDTWM
jgi:hypothetical protein